MAADDCVYSCRPGEDALTPAVLPHIQASMVNLRTSLRGVRESLVQ